MAPLQMPLDQSGFPSGSEHLDANRLLDGYTDHGEYAEWTAGLETSPNDTQQYRLVRLKNGIECMLVHNPTVETCAASMAVRVGHLQDPEELPGLAHFLEHLLFMGSAKYPGENEYADHLSKFGGWSNAYTSTHQTVYFFETTHAGFEGALDRFAQFFVSPLFNENCVEKEIKAVDSEHQKDLQDDGWRLQQLRRSLSKADHPYHKFGTGDLETLWNRPRAQGLDIRAELIKFYEKHYSANLMKLCVTSRDPLDSTLNKVLHYFSEVGNRNIPPTIFPEDPYPDTLHMTRIAMKQIKDESCILIQMPFYDSSKTLGSKPASLISYLLSNKGPHSLFGFLKKKGLVTYLEAYPYNAAPGIHFYVIECGLTHEGIKHHQLIASTAYEYIKLLKSQPFPSWVYQELRQMLQISFRFLEARGSVSNAAVAISVALHNSAPRAQVFAAPYTLTDDDPKSLKHALTYLVKDKAQIIVTCPVEIEGLTYNEREQWYGTEYAINPLKADWFEASLAPDEKLLLPEENRFIPKNLQIIGKRDASKPFPRPLLIKQTEGQRIWFKQDDRWKVPKGSFFVKLSKGSYKNGVLCGSYLYLVNDALEKYADDAAVAGLRYSVLHHQSFLQISVSGFTDKLPDLLKLILHELKHLKLDQKAFDLMKEEKLKSLENETHDKPVQQVSSELSWILSSAGTTFDQRKEILNAMKAEDIKAFSEELLSKFYVEALCHGNFTKTTMYELVSMTEEVLNYSRLPRSAILSPRSRIIPEKSDFVVRMVASSKEEVNNAIRYYMSVGHPNDPDLFARLLLLRTLIAEPCFNTLRTKEQLGYLVGANTMTGSSHCGLVVVIQSARSPVYLELRINAFLKEFDHTLESMDVEKFESAKNGLITTLSEDYKNQTSESSTYWSHISDGSYDFFESDRLTALLKPLSLRDIHAFYTKHVHPASETRAKVSVHLYSHRVHLTDIDKLVEVLDEHKVDCEPVKAAVKEQPLPKALREVVEKHVKATVPDLHNCCKEEILREVDALDSFPSLEKDLPNVKIINSVALKNSLTIGEPRKPIGDFYDGVANL